MAAGRGLETHAVVSFVMRSFMVCTRCKEPVARVENRRNAYRVLVKKKLKERDNFGDLDINGDVILHLSYRNRMAHMDWLHLAQGRSRWQVLVKTIKTLQIPQNAGNILTSRGTVAFSKAILLHRVNQLIVTSFNAPNLRLCFCMRRSFS